MPARRRRRLGAASRTLFWSVGIWAAPILAGPALAQQDDFSAGPERAGRIAVGETVTGHLERPGDVDWFALELAAGVAYAFDQEGADTRQGTLSDPLLTLLDRDGNPVGHDDDGGAGFNARLLFSVERGGRYYIAAGAYGDATGTYRVTVIEYSGFEDDIGDTPEQARGIGIGESVTGTVEVPGDTDVFAVSLEAGIRYAIDLEGQPTGRGTLPDPYVALLGAAGGLIAEDDDGGEGLNAQLMFVPDKSGAFLIGVSGYGASAGTYTLTVREADAPMSEK